MWFYLFTQFTSFHVLDFSFFLHLFSDVGNHKKRKPDFKEAVSIHLMEQKMALTFASRCPQVVCGLDSANTQLNGSCKSLHKKKNPKQKHRSHSCCRIWSSRSLSPAHFHVAMENFCCWSRKSGGATCPSPRARAKIIGVWYIKSCWNFSLRFGISILKVTAGSQCISVMLQERQIIQTGKQCKRCATASEPHRQDPFYHLSPFSSPLFCLFDALSASNLSKGEDSGPIIGKWNPTMGLWLRATSPPSFQGGGHAARVKPRHRFRCDLGNRFFSHRVGSTFQRSQSARGNWNN